MEDVINTSIFKGIVFCVYGTLGPQPIYMIPEPKKLGDQGLNNKDSGKENKYIPNLRQYTQIAIKNLSLLIGDGSILNKENLIDHKYHAIIPFPDLNATSLTYYHFIPTNFNNGPLASAFCILIDENNRSFFYNNINRLREIIENFFMEFDKQLLDEFKPQKEVEADLRSLLNQILDIESHPSTPISTHRKMKIICAGLDDSGKTSFLLSVNKQFSKLIGIKPTRSATISSIETLGANIFLWDLGGQISLRKKYLNKAQIYLFEADLIYYFIDLKYRNRFKESIDYLKNILDVLNKMNQKTPIIIILSKGDPDIIDTYLMKENLRLIQKDLQTVFKNEMPEIFITTIFEIFSILRAFSSGLAKLSPNRELLKLNLDSISQEADSLLTLLLTDDGLVLADYYSSRVKEMIELPKDEDLVSIFELSAPEFTRLFKIFSRYKSSEVNEAVFNVSDSIIFLKKAQMKDSIMYLLFLIESEDKIEKINSKFPKFIETTQDLIIRYIS